MVSDQFGLAGWCGRSGDSPSSPWTNLPRQERRCIPAGPLWPHVHIVMYALQYVIHGLQCLCPGLHSALLLGPVALLPALAARRCTLAAFEGRCIRAGSLRFCGACPGASTDRFVAPCKRGSPPLSVLARDYPRTAGSESKNREGEPGRPGIRIAGPRPASGRGRGPVRMRLGRLVRDPAQENRRELEDLRMRADPH